MKKIYLVVVIFCILAVFSCQDRIRYGKMKTQEVVDLVEINDNPGAFLKLKCEVWGYVTTVKDVPLAKTDVFKIFDGTDEIWVFTTRGVPPLGARLRIKGTVYGVGHEPLGITLPIFGINIPVKPEMQFFIYLNELEFI